MVSAPHAGAATAFSSQRPFKWAPAAAGFTLACALIMPAQATFINNSSGLLNPQQTIDFESAPLTFNQAVSTEFQSFGVTFSNAFGNPDPSTTYSHISGNRIGNFQANGPGAAGALVLDFNSVLSSMAFAMVTAPGTSTIQAFLNGSLVESFNAATSAFDPNNFYGFKDILFNRVTMSVASFDTALMIDNLQTGAAGTVPEPGSSASWALLMLAGMAGLRRSGQRKPTAP